VKELPRQQHEFLHALQQRIDRYKPVLEQEFDVVLGDVAAAPLSSRKWLASIFAKSDRELHAATVSRYGRPPTATRLCLHELEKLLLRLPALAYLAWRQWYPDFYVKWDDDARQVLVSFSGWSVAAYAKRIPSLDQIAVHEMAHGVWDRLAQDQRSSHSRRWRMWNEGFAHYIADIHMKPRYPPTAVVATEFSESRKRALRLVDELVDEFGSQILRSVPQRWPEFDERAALRSGNAPRR
jgi:hypothetical protein